MNKWSNQNKWWDQIVKEYVDLNLLLDQSYSNLTQLDEMVLIQKKLAGLNKKYKLAQEAQDIDANINFLQEVFDSENDDSILKEIQELKNRLEQIELMYSDLLQSAKLSLNKLILEVRPGTGGQEAGLFAGLLVEMYKAYADDSGWDWEICSYEESSIGGITQVTVSIEGDDAYGLMQYESGVHRVQRIPQTEAKGRIHTSTATVAVLPEPEETNIEINENYIRIDVFRASGAGGQHVNKTESAIRLTYDHPDLDKIVISIQDEKSQHKNKAKAMKILRAKVQEQLEAKANSERASQRRSQVGTGDRSEKIRTYNFQQNRVTDHRSGLSVHNLQEDILLMPKDLDQIFKSLKISELKQN
jgi:peptide chain release factor 1